MQSQTTKQTHANLYGSAGLIYIRAPAKVETRTNGQQKIKANPFPNHALIKEQPKIHSKQWGLLCLVNGARIPPWAIRASIRF